MVSINQRALFRDGQSQEELCTLIRDELQAHLAEVGLGLGPNGLVQDDDHKAVIRANHAAHRRDYKLHESKFVQQRGRLLLKHFADGRQVVPSAIDPVLCPVVPHSEEADLFRFATLLWSVPVSRGYGRRMRFIVRDRSNGKLVGLFALADPVFNLRARDTWIGWTVNDRRQRLVNVMDAHVAGAVPPYDSLLGGKLVASLMTSQEVCDAFTDKYGNTRGIISNEYKHARLTLITVTSALGRSSLYNRLKLPGIVEFLRIGMTEGWGHFHIPDHLFLSMRRLLELEGHKYASGHQYGQGPNWRMRVVREALIRTGLDPDVLMKHGISREVFAAPLTSNWRDFLCGRTTDCAVSRPSAAEIGQIAVARWMVPRADRRPDFHTWTKYDTWRALVDTD